MNRFSVKILGCGSATPTLLHHPTSQILNIREKLFMIDCGEGTQLQMRKYGVNFSRLTRIFVSHLHGDHCFGLIGLISTLNLLGRTGDLFIHSEPSLEDLLLPQIKFFAPCLTFKVHFIPFDTQKSEMIYEDKSLTVRTIPLQHRIPCVGFLFEEKPILNHIIPEMIKFYEVPVREIARIKAGGDFITPDGRVIPHGRLTRPAPKAKKYAYCSDTRYTEAIIPWIEEVDLLFHESTFMQSEYLRAQKTFHSTAQQAASIAQQARVKQLMIGHFSARYTNLEPMLQEAKSVFENTILANEGLEIDV